MPISPMDQSEFFLRWIPTQCESASRKINSEGDGFAEQLSPEEMLALGICADLEFDLRPHEDGSPGFKIGIRHPMRVDVRGGRLCVREVVIGNASPQE
jgi:hypothetical protein